MRRSFRKARRMILTVCKNVLIASVRPISAVKPHIVQNYSTKPSTVIELPQPEQDKENNNKRRTWEMGTDWKIVASVVIGVSSYFLNARAERKYVKQEMKLRQIERQIKDLYGPLYGNRIVSDTSYCAIMKDHKALEVYLQEAGERKDAGMIQQWRTYVWDVLYPLDKAAVKMICDNAHLIAGTTFPTEFKQLLEHVAKLEFVMGHWKSDNGNLESTKKFNDEDYLESNNDSGMGQREQIYKNIKQIYDELREQQQDLALAISNEKKADSLLLSFLQKFSM